MWRATLKSLLAARCRLLLTALSVVLGVGFIAGTYVLTDTMNAAFDELFSSAAQSSDVVVRAESAFDRGAVGPRRRGERGAGSGPGDTWWPTSRDRRRRARRRERDGIRADGRPGDGGRDRGVRPPHDRHELDGHRGSSAVTIRQGDRRRGPTR